MQKEMMQQISELTHTLREVSDKLHEKSVQITVESLHVDKATLENLIFRLDSLDIHDLSGSLNLGNNFGQPLGSTSKSTSNVRLQDGTPQGARIQKAIEPGSAKSTTNQPMANKNRLWASTANSPVQQTRLPVKTTDGRANLEETDRGFAIRF